MAASDLIPIVPQIFSEEKVVNVAEVNQCDGVFCLEANRARFESRLKRTF